MKPHSFSIPSSVWDCVKLLFILLSILSLAYSQNQVLLRINEQGVQEAIPIPKNQNVRDLLEQLDKQKNVPSSVDVRTERTGITDKLKYYDSTQTASNFGFNHQDVQMAWFNPEATGIVKMIVWHNYGLKGDIGKATIRAWKVDPRLSSLPIRAGNGGSNSAMGYYIDANDSDGNVTAFKNKATNPNFVPAVGMPDSAAISFDPLGTEAIHARLHAL